MILGIPDHDVHIEAIRPSILKQAGCGLTLCFGYCKTPFGDVFLALANSNICTLVFVEEVERLAPLVALQKKWPKAKYIEDTKKVIKVIGDLFNAKQSSINLLVSGSDFQIKVWRALLKVRKGCVVSYGDIAKSIGRPKAARAVGTAIAANPVALAIPCHRIVQKSGKLGRYRWGVERKRALLIDEGVFYTH